MMHSRKYADYRRWALIAVAVSLWHVAEDNDGSAYGWFAVAIWTVGIVILLSMAYRDRQDRIRLERKFTEALKNDRPVMIWRSPEEDR